MPRLLVAEVEINVLASIRRIAGLMGYVVDGVTQRRDFQMTYLRSPPDAVIVDMSLPDIGAGELIKWIADVGPPNLTILTADLPRDALDALCLRGMPGNILVRPLAKPFNNSDLTNLLRPLL